MTVLRENSLKKIELSQIRQSLAGLVESGENLEQNFKKSEMEIKIKEEKIKSEIESMERDIGNKRALVHAQIDNIETMIKHLATNPTSSSGSTSGKQVDSASTEPLRQRIEFINQNYRDEVDELKNQLNKFKNIGTSIPQIKADIGQLEHKLDLRIRNSTDVDTR